MLYSQFLSWYCLLIFVITLQTSPILPNTVSMYTDLIDDQLSFKSNINFLEKKLSRSVGVMVKLSYHLPPNALVTLSLISTYSFDIP